MTLAEMFAKTQDLPPGHDRLAAAAWAEPLGTDVARAVRECRDHGVLEALAMELGQALPALRFEESVRNAIPEVAWPLQHMRDDPSPSNAELEQHVKNLRSADPALRAAAQVWLDADHDRFARTRLGRAIALRPTPEMLAARIEELRAALDVAVMQRALDARPHDETLDERESRLLAETRADQERLRRDDDAAATSSIRGALVGTALRKVRPETMERDRTENGRRTGPDRKVEA